MKELELIKRKAVQIFSEEELERESNTQKMRVPFSDKLVPYYSHDVIISVGIQL